MTHPNTIAHNAVQAAHFAVCAAVGRTGREMALYQAHQTAWELCLARSLDKTLQAWDRAEWSALAAEMNEAADSYLARA